jgi:hypothetical protein
MSDRETLAPRRHRAERVIGAARSFPAGLAGLAALLACAACGDAVGALGPTPAEAALRADALIEAAGFHLGPIERDPRMERVGARLARAALIPSGVFDDAALWTASVPEERTLGIWAIAAAGRARVAVHPDPPAPARPGEYRASYRLRRLGKGEYAWRMADELALGPVGADDLARALTTLLTRAAGQSGTALRRRLHAELPRAAAVASRLYALETMEIDPADDGTAAITIAVRLDPSGLGRELPRYAAYLRKHAVHFRVEVAASDAEGARFWEARVRDGRAALRLRVQSGSLVPLSGPPRRMPERIRVSGEVSMKAGLFRIGMKRLEADVSLDRAPGRTGFVARFQREPDWQLPLLLEPFLRSSLRRPFEKEGSWAALTLRPGEGASSVLANEYELAIKESWIVRWLNAVFGSAVGEYRSGAEEEAGRYHAQLLGAFREDVRALTATNATVPRY